jgi:hypothetical protein
MQMMKYIRLFCFTVMLCPIWLLSSCGTAFIQFEQYEERPLTIGVIGTPLKYGKIIALEVGNDG